MKKKMRSAAAMVLGFVLAGAVLTGCGEKQQGQQETQESSYVSTSQETEQDSAPEKAESEMSEGESETPEGESETSEGETESPQVYEDNFAVDSAAAKEFAEKVKAAVADKDLEAFADLTSFPVYVGLPDVNVVETREDFLNLGADTVFTQTLQNSIENADIDNLQPSRAGFSISGGGTSNINFGVVDGKLAVSGINY